MNKNGNIQVFEFQALPIPIFQKHNTANHQKFLEQNHYRNLQQNSNNLLFRNQVIKGKTFLNKLEIDRLKKGSQKPQKKLKKSKKKNLFANESFLNEIKPKPGHSHASCNTDIYKEILEDNVVTKTISVQTDPLLNRPVQKNFKEQKSGIDQSTQIQREDGLIDFDKLVKPILRVLLNKTLEESRMEVLEEIELENMKNQRKIFVQKKMALLNQVQKINQSKNRYKKEISKRINQSIHGRDCMKSVHQKLVSKFFAKKLMNQIFCKGFDVIIEKENFFDSYKNSVYLEVFPQCFQNIQNILNVDNYCRFVCENLSENQNQQILLDHKNYLKQHQQNQINYLQNLQVQKEEKLKQKEQKKQQKIKNKIKQHLIQNLNTKQSSIIICDHFVSTDNLQIRGQNLLGILLSLFCKLDLSNQIFNTENFFQRLLMIFLNLNIKIIVNIDQENLQKLQEILEQQNSSEIFELLNKKLLSNENEENQEFLNILIDQILNNQEQKEKLKECIQKIFAIQKSFNYNIFQFEEIRQSINCTHLIKINKIEVNIDTQNQENEQEKIIKSQNNLEQQLQPDQKSLLQELLQKQQQKKICTFNLTKKFKQKFMIYQQEFLKQILQQILEFTKPFVTEKDQQKFLEQMTNENQNLLDEFVKDNDIKVIEIELDN